MQFLYPKSRQFPFDEVCDQIVRALEARAWKVPGLVVEFRDYGSGAQKLRCVSKIQSDQSAIDLGQHDVMIEFGRPQGTLPGRRWNDIAAVNEVRLPRRSLRVYEDESGPTYNVYVGDAWEQDRSTWWLRPNVRLNKKPRLCIRYAGMQPYRGARVADLVCVGDYREYPPEGEEPRSFRTVEVMEEFRVYLHDVVLPAIEAYPVATALDAYVEPPPIQMPVGVGPFFTYGEPRDARRIELGKKCVDELQLADRYGMQASGWRLAHLGIKIRQVLDHGDAGSKSHVDMPEVAYDGFLWCGVTLSVPGEHGRGFADQLIKVTPKDARGIYVADHAVYVKRRAELVEAIKDQRDTFTQAEVDDFIRDRACTIVPITEYKGNYEDPIYLINRELGFDEVEVIGRRPE
jgi:hypothetical protein